MKMERRRPPSWAKAGVAGAAVLAGLGLVLVAVAFQRGPRGQGVEAPTELLVGKASAAPRSAFAETGEIGGAGSLLKEVGGRLAADERIAEDTVRVLKAEQRLRTDMGGAKESAVARGAAIRSEVGHLEHQRLMRSKQAKLAAAAPQPGGEFRIGGVVITGAEIGKIVKDTVARLKARISESKLSQSQQGSGMGEVHTAHMLAAAAAGGNATNSTEGEEDVGAFDQDDGGMFDWLTHRNAVLEGEDVGPVPKENYNWLQDSLTTDQLKNASEAPPGSLTAMAGEGTYDELGVEKPYLAIPQAIDVATARATPRWARKGYKGDPAFEMERMGEYDSHKPKWKALVYGEAADYLRPDDKYVPVHMVKNQLNPHVGHQPLDLFKPLRGIEATAEEGEGEEGKGLMPHNGRSAEEDANPMADPRSDKEKKLLFGDLNFLNKPWSKRQPFSLTDKRVHVEPNHEVTLKRFLTTGTAERGDGGFEPRLDTTPRHTRGQEGA